MLFPRERQAKRQKNELLWKRLFSVRLVLHYFTVNSKQNTKVAWKRGETCQQKPCRGQNRWGWSGRDVLMKHYSSGIRISVWLCFSCNVSTNNLAFLLHEVDRLNSISFRFPTIPPRFYDFLPFPSAGSFPRSSYMSHRYLFLPLRDGWCAALVL